MSSRSGIRNLVRSVVNETGESTTGGFEDEMMRTFFAEIKGLVNAAFHALFEEVQQVTGKDSAWRKAAMERGLAFMNDRRNESSIIDSVVESEDACRSLTKQYFAAMNSFVRDTMQKKRDILHVNFVPFGTFIARLYRKLSSVPEMKEAYFTTMSYTEKDMLLADVLRQVMQASVMGPSGSGAPPPPSFSTPIKPSDSVSNISNLPTQQASVVGSVVGQKVARSIMGKDETGITPDKLSIHNSNSASRFSNFTPASVTGGSRVNQKKVVTVGQTDQHALPSGPRGGDTTSHVSSHVTSTEVEQ